MPLLYPATATAIFSEPVALASSGPVLVSVDVEIGEGEKLLPAAALQSHVEQRLGVDGVMTVSGGQDPEFPSVVAQRHPAEARVSVAARRTDDPEGYIITLQFSHVQPAMLRRSQSVAALGLDWQESWAFVVKDDADKVMATNNALDSLTDDFARDYQTANHSR